MLCHAMRSCGASETFIRPIRLSPLYQQVYTEICLTEYDVFLSNGIIGADAICRVMEVEPHHRPDHHLVVMAVDHPGTGDRL